MESTKQPKRRIDFNIQNIVSTFNGGVAHLDLKKLCNKLKWCQLNNKVFAALIARLESPKTTLLLFTVANNVCTGAKSIVESRIACRMISCIMQERGIECTMRNFRVQNIVASAYTGFPLNLEQMASVCVPEASYDPELFPVGFFSMQKSHESFVYRV